MMSLASDVYVSLDTLSKRIWSELERPTTSAELCQILLAEFDVPAEICEHDILRLLNQLHEYRLIRIVPSQPG